MHSQLYCSFDFNFYLQGNVLEDKFSNAPSYQNAILHGVHEVSIQS